MTKRGTLFLFLTLAGCGALPKDPDDTFDRVAQSRIIRVGLSSAPDDSEFTHKFLGVIEQRTGAKARITQGASEPLLAALEEGKLDLVVGPFAAKSPLETIVSFGPPLAISGKGEARIETKAAMRNGENRWIMLVESASRRAVPKSARQ